MLNRNQNVRIWTTIDINSSSCAAKSCPIGVSGKLKLKAWNVGGEITCTYSLGAVNRKHCCCLEGVLRQPFNTNSSSCDTQSLFGADFGLAASTVNGSRYRAMWADWFFGEAENLDDPIYVSTLIYRFAGPVIPGYRCFFQGSGNLVTGHNGSRYFAWLKHYKFNQKF